MCVYSPRARHRKNTLRKTPRQGRSCNAAEGFIQARDPSRAERGTANDGGRSG
ncbi:unnamed protein product, partial [Ectocarpus sp. 6 AP-2014]